VPDEGRVNDLWGRNGRGSEHVGGWCTLYETMGELMKHPGTGRLSANAIGEIPNAKGTRSPLAPRGGTTRINRFDAEFPSRRTNLYSKGLLNRQAVTNSSSMMDGQSNRSLVGSYHASTAPRHPDEPAVNGLRGSERMPLVLSATASAGVQGTKMKTEKPHAFSSLGPPVRSAIAGAVGRARSLSPPNAGVGLQCSHGSHFPGAVALHAGKGADRIVDLAGVKALTYRKNVFLGREAAGDPAIIKHELNHALGDRQSAVWFWTSDDDRDRELYVRALVRGLREGRLVGFDWSRMGYGPLLATRVGGATPDAYRVDAEGKGNSWLRDSLGASGEGRRPG
jgi:hypothetical protein